MEKSYLTIEDAGRIIIRANSRSVRELDEKIRRFEARLHLVTQTDTAQIASLQQIIAQLRVEQAQKQAAMQSDIDGMLQQLKEIADPSQIDALIRRFGATYHVYFDTEKKLSTSPPTATVKPNKIIPLVTGKPANVSAAADIEASKELSAEGPEAIAEAIRRRNQGA